MKKSNSNIPFNKTIQFRMTAIFLTVMLVLILINTYIYYNVSDIVSDMNKVYEKNFMLNSLEDELKSIQESMTGYLETKSTEAMGNYYKHVQDYNNLLEGLNQKIYNEKHLLMEKNIYNLSGNYIKSADKSIEYKRGRDIERYRVSYEETVVLYRYLTDYIDSLNTDMFKSNSSNYQEMFSMLNSTQRLSMSILFAASFIIIVLVAYATRRITRPLSRLAIAAGTVAKGNLDIEPVQPVSNDEVGVVTNAFNSMLENIREYIDRITENMERERILHERELMMENHLKEAELNYLQAQIDPHFLFNTLNAGAQLAMMEEADKTYEYIQNVADLYRYKIAKNNTVTLLEELNIVDNYMYIINVRFSGDISYTRDIDETLTGIIVPSMILQPVVENAVRYGVRDIDWPAKIHISVSLEDDCVCVSVRDNGVGISKETIDKIFDDDYSQPIHEESTGIGLKNVISRMRIFYNKEDVMFITSEGSNQGTEIAIMIPYEQAE